MLTKEAKTVLYQLYKEYLVRRDGNVSRSRAKCFSSAESIHASLFPDWSLEDVEDVLRELGRNGFLDNSYADDTIYDCSLSDVAIVKMENQKKETLLTVADLPKSTLRNRKRPPKSRASPNFGSPPQ